MFIISNEVRSWQVVNEYIQLFKKLNIYLLKVLPWKFLKDWLQKVFVIVEHLWGLL